jgi:hypothetical protein
MLAYDTVSILSLDSFGIFSLLIWKKSNILQLKVVTVFTIKFMKEFNFKTKIVSRFVFQTLSNFLPTNKVS